MADMDTTTEDTTVDTDGTTDAPVEAAESAADEFTPPTREEWTRTQTALKKANAEAKKHRERAQEIARANEDDTAKAAREADEQAQARYKPVAVKAAARAEFLAAGLNDPSGDRISKLARLLDMDQVDIDADGEFTGLADQVASIKSDYPELFEKKAPKPGRVDTAGRQPVVDRPKSTGERHAEMILGAGQYGRD